ncbi:sugar ABC transporter permease [Ferroacidibacillus organovorans]|uniref:Sugar ABC transporter permease n=1 Tax=Ferroacidibacillus organovorans TaxID=1765683 RepID=A0A117SXX8_9BACL|nr:sugar ABC transporter permease [Ferroacidibacillus organovorans]KUO96096.1 sugar ABC transporter permease [Ferroacidibacillus organovorans]
MASLATGTHAFIPKKKTLAPGQRLVLWVSRIIIWFFILLAMFPIYFVLLASLKGGQSFFSGNLFPRSITLQNYWTLLTQTSFLTWMRNSLIVGLLLGTVQIIFTATSAYAFSRMKFFGRKYGLMTLLLLQMFPNALAVSAILAVLTQLNLLDNLYIYVLVQAGGSAFNIWLLKGYLDTIPRELDEAAVMDGANSMQIYLRIILPLSVPMLVVIFLFTFIGSFNEFLLGSTILQSPSNYTLPIGLFQFIQGQFAKNWTEFSAAALLAAVPLTVLYAVFQKWIVSGLVAGSVKG